MPRTSKDLSNRTDLKYWRSRGLEDTSYQRQAQTTWWSVLGGIAIGILVTQISPVLDALKTAQWYTLLYFFATLLIVTYSWIQTSWGSLILRWPITIAGSLSLLVTTMACAFASLNLDNPPAWMASLTIAAFSSFFMQFYFYLTGAWDVFSADKLRRYRNSLWIYAGLAVVVAGFTVHMFLKPTQTNFVIYGIVAVVFSVALLAWQGLAMNAEKREMRVP